MKVAGMHCGSCAMHIDETLAEIPGVASSRTSYDDGQTVVHHDPAVAPADALAGAIAELGYQAETVPI